MRYVLLLITVLACACSRNETSAPSERATAPAKPTTTVTAPVERPAENQAPEAVLSRDAVQTVELVDSGKPPLVELRATFEPGSTHKLRISVDWVVTAGYGPAISAKSTMPSFLYELEAEAKETNDGATLFALRITEATSKSGEGVNPNYVSLAGKAVEAVKSASGTVTVNARGMIQSLRIDRPSDANMLIHDMLDQVERGVRLAILPLPEAPIGQGARWKATHVAQQRGALSEQTSTYELVSLKGSTAEVKLSHQASTPKQVIQLPGTPTKLTLDSMDFTGEGEGTWDLRKLIPKSASETTVTLFKMMSSGAKPDTVLMQNDSTLKVEGTR